MSDGIRMTCPNCGARYRLPAETAGRAARCKKCGEKFVVPAEKSLEDSVLDWLDEADTEREEAVSQPRVISMTKEEAETEEARKSRAGPIRIKSQ